jgi:hypothetical protein
MSARISSAEIRNSRTWAIYDASSLTSRFVHITWLSWSRFSSFSCAGKKISTRVGSLVEFQRVAWYIPTNWMTLVRVEISPKDSCTCD